MTPTGDEDRVEQEHSPAAGSHAPAPGQAARAPTVRALRRSITIESPEFLAMTDEQRRAAVDAVRALLLPSVREEGSKTRRAA